MERVFREGTRFVDESGRQVFFNGVNISLKGEKKGEKTVYKFDTVREKTIAALHARGINLIRLVLTWDGVEPHPGIYDEVYLDHYREIVSWCERYEIYVILDMHQDLYSSRIGDGAPEWATLTDGYPIEKPVAIWAEGYFYSRAVAHSFEHFWNNTPVYGKGLQDWYAAMWQHVIRIFADSPALLGFDFINEPYPGLEGPRIFTDLLDGFMDRLGGGRELPFDAARYLNRENQRAGFVRLGLEIGRRVKRCGLGRMRRIGEDRAALREIFARVEPVIRRFDEEKYMPFLCRMAEAARMVTDRGVILIDNCYYSNLGIPCSVKIPTVNGVPEEQVAFAPHGYDLFVDSPLYRFASEARVGMIFEEHHRTQERLGVPVLVGEWGGFSSYDGYHRHTEFLLDLFNRNRWSRSYWAYSPQHFALHPIWRMLTRSYPQAVSGTVSKVESDDSILSFSYIQEGETAPNRVYLNGRLKSLSIDGQAVGPGQYLMKTADHQKILLEFSTPKGEHSVRIETEN